jgi:23S rRNA (cytidine1920-2'-O)/16S rRNA (cytidine1409-2'-O)-methyltransferase
MGSPATAKIRLDALLVERGLAESRARAQALILAGGVTVEGKEITKAGAQVSRSARIEVRDSRLKYASRAGAKLAGALEDFRIDAAGRVCLDVGASTGGFTDCLLQAGAARVYAVDVNVKQLDWKLKQDSRVVSIGKNARFLRAEDLPEAASLVTVDLSFISVSKVLPALVPLAGAGADFLILVKPQFELERGAVGKGGIVRDARLRERAVENARRAAEACGLDAGQALESRVPGAEGNVEFFLHARKPALRDAR